MGTAASKGRRPKLYAVTAFVNSDGLGGECSRGGRIALSGGDEWGERMSDGSALLLGRVVGRVDRRPSLMAPSISKERISHRRYRRRNESPSTFSLFIQVWNTTLLPGPVTVMAIFADSVLLRPAKGRTPLFVAKTVESAAR